jgi:hypothetical protein
MTSLALLPHRLTGTGCSRPPARACGRRLRHTRRYVTSLISLTRITDTQALDRLRQRVRQSSHVGVLGLTALADTLVLRYPAK